SSFRLPPSDPLVRLRRDRVEPLVDRPRALLRLRPLRLAVERRVDDPDRVSPLLGGPEFEREAAVRAVVTDALLVPRPVVPVAGDAELVRCRGTRAGVLDLVPALHAPARAARVERDHDLVVVLLDLELAAPVRPAEVGAHRLEREVGVAEDGL